MCYEECEIRNRIIKPVSYTAGGNFIINTNFTDTDAENRKRYELILTVNLPSMTTIVPVFITFNGTNIPMLDDIGNNLMSDQLHTRKRYRLVYGINPKHLTVLNCLGSSAFYPVEETEEDV